ncbi:hypothetical protein IF1G_04796 [Cordyceps javanica]|uniref:Secreted protein n=1 Tax=Cordyceps javanica TaxID=43265 RepID=A0A545V3C5_9HYPO|nr:hypothetical protein IF1G_04796 [Cordyceps javanica]
MMRYSVALTMSVLACLALRKTTSSSFEDGPWFFPVARGCLSGSPLAELLSVLLVLLENSVGSPPPPHHKYKLAPRAERIHQRGKKCTSPSPPATILHGNHTRWSPNCFTSLITLQHCRDQRSSCRATAHELSPFSYQPISSIFLFSCFSFSFSFSASLTTTTRERLADGRGTGPECPRTALFYSHGHESMRLRFTIPGPLVRHHRTTST